MKISTLARLLLAILLATPAVHAGEVIVYEGEVCDDEPISLLKEALNGGHLGFPKDDDGPGTLFQWSYGTSFSGGPNLDEPLVTDRPDFTEASVTVGRRVLQVEFGYTFTMDDEGASRFRSHSAGEPLFRYGIGADWLELRFALFPVSERSTDGGGWTTRGGTEDLYLGTKIALTPQECHFPETALILQSTVPTGTRYFTNDEVLPGINYLYAWEINDTLAIGGSTQANRTIDEGSDRPYVDIAQSATLVLGLSDELSMYTEWYAFFPVGADTAQVEHYINGGFAYLLSNDVQFDIRVGYGLSRASDDFYVGSGLTIRFR